MPILSIIAAVSLTAGQTADVRCVAVVGIASRTDPALVPAGREFAARVGASIMDRKAATREEVGNAFLAEGQRVGKTVPDSIETDRCIARMTEWLSR